MTAVWPAPPSAEDGSPRHGQFDQPAGENLGFDFQLIDRDRQAHRGKAWMSWENTVRSSMRASGAPIQ
jgi:hypothetical protein